MEAGTLQCPTCGAAAVPEAARCGYCHATLATIACPACFSLMFIGTKHCSHCGAQAARVPAEGERQRPCPHCQVSLSTVQVGSVPLHECADCGGLWLKPESFARICEDAETHARMLGEPPPIPHPVRPVRYVRCPDCGDIMNRLNFARVSGVVIDTCKTHGVWFDKDELRQVMEFIRNNGMELARRQELSELSEERKRLESLIDRPTCSRSFSLTSDSTATVPLGVRIAMELLSWLIN